MYNYVLLGEAQGMYPFSFPGTIQLTFRYMISFEMGNRTFLTNYWFYCLGALVNRRTIITPASCVPNVLLYSPSGHGNDMIEIPVVLNDLYPSWQSIVSVYVGINKFMTFEEDVTPTQMEIIDEIIIVRII